MSKISELPEYLRQNLLKQLPAERILEALSDEEKITAKQNVCVHSSFGNRNQQFITFAPYKPIFKFFHTDMDFLDKNPDDIIEPHSIDLNYFDCLELLRMHYENIVIRTKK